MHEADLLHTYVTKFAREFSFSPGVNETTELLSQPFDFIMYPPFFIPVFLVRHNLL